MTVRVQAYESLIALFHKMYGVFTFCNILLATVVDTEVSQMVSKKYSRKHTSTSNT
jgi:hypothetical protein